MHADLGSLLVVPLRHDGNVIGTLGVASAGGRRQFRESSLRFGRALGDLAAVALHRAEALDSERRARAEAESAVRTRDAVVSIVSHDLRNPLMAILGSADLLLELTGRAGHETERTQLATLKHAADSMNRLIRDLLDVTRLESGPLPVQRRTLNLLDVVDDVVGMFQIVVRARHLTLTREARISSDGCRRSRSAGASVLESHRQRREVHPGWWTDQDQPRSARRRGVRLRS